MMLLCLMSSKASGQHIIWIKGVTRFLINEHRDLSILKEKEINLNGQINELSIKNEALIIKLKSSTIISSAKDEIIEVIEEQKELSKKELRKAKRQQLWSDIKSQWRVIVAGTVGIATGVALGKLSP